MLHPAPISISESAACFRVEQAGEHSKDPRCPGPHRRCKLVLLTTSHSYFHRESHPFSTPPGFEFWALWPIDPGPADADADAGMYWIGHLWTET